MIQLSGVAAFPVPFLEEAFLQAFEDAKFYGLRIEDLRSEPYQTVEGIEFRAITITAYKGKEGACIERNQAVIYRGPWKQVVDDDESRPAARRAGGGLRENLPNLFQNTL